MTSNNKNRVRKTNTHKQKPKQKPTNQEKQNKIHTHPDTCQHTAHIRFLRKLTTSKSPTTFAEYQSKATTHTNLLQNAQ